MSQMMSFNFGMVSPIRTFKANGLTNNNLRKVSEKLVNNRNSATSEINISEVKTELIRNNQVLQQELLQKNLAKKGSKPYYKHFPMFTEGDKDEYQQYTGFDKIDNEDPFKINPYALTLMNNFKHQYINKLPIALELGKKPDGGKVTPLITEQAIAMSLFNPMYMVNVRGISSNVPLINSATSESLKNSPFGYNTSDCTIRELVRLSHLDNSILGNARYRYSDFMYCKDLGKIANNHLITLRVFPYPIGDHIFEMASPMYYSKLYSFTNTGDIGRLVTWFGTEDNKLEDILTYDYNASWKELNAEIEEVNSREDDPSKRGPLGMLINTFTPAYNESVDQGYAGNASMWKYIGGTPARWDNDKILTNYDKNKVYTPTDTVQNTHTYEGKLTFNHEFTLNFCYRLRAYDNINPKSAFLDLIGNIMAVTYRRGHFWGGDRKWIGPPQNQSAWTQANSIIDGKFDEVGGIFQSLMDNGFSLGALLGSIGDLGNLIKNSVSEAGEAAQKFLGIDSGSSLKEKVQQGIKGAFEKGHFAAACKGIIKNALGRPAQYAMNSLLKGDDVGLWHVTIGNPKNPIASIGNLILTKAVVTQSGALGVDDFPSEIKVSVTLKHGRGRDAVDIARMYTKGLNGIYMLPKLGQLSTFYQGVGADPTTAPNESSSDGKEKTPQKQTQQSATEKEAEDKLNDIMKKQGYSEEDMNDPEKAYAVSIATKDEYIKAKNAMVENMATSNYEWFGQTYLETFKRIIQEMA